MAKKEKDPNTVALGRKGDKARLHKMTPEQRQEIARKAVTARWARAGNPAGHRERGVDVFFKSVTGLNVTLVASGVTIPVMTINGSKTRSISIRR